MSKTTKVESIPAEQPARVPPPAACCDTSEQAACCEPSEKASCCPPEATGSEGCGCR